jgi:hypothetical protein
MEVIVVDNGSDDNSVELIRQSHPDVLIVESPVNRGFATGCEMGIVQSTGELIVLLNNDTRLDHDAFQSLFDEMVERDLDVIAAVLAPYDGGEVKPQRSVIDPLGYPIFLKPADRFGKGKSFFLSAACVLVSKETYLDTGGLDTSFFMYYEDVDWFWRMALYGRQFDYSFKTVVYHFATGSAHGLKFDYKRFMWRNTNQPRVLIKNYRLLSLLLVLPIFFITYIFEALVLVVIGRRDLAKTYGESFVALVRNLRPLLENRRIVQRRRTIGDRQIFSMMYPGLASVSGLWERALAIKNRSA